MNRTTTLSPTDWQVYAQTLASMKDISAEKLEKLYYDAKKKLLFLSTPSLFEQIVKGLSKKNTTMLLNILEDATVNEYLTSNSMIIVFKYGKPTLQELMKLRKFSLKVSTNRFQEKAIFHNFMECISREAPQEFQRIWAEDRKLRSKLNPSTESYHLLLRVGFHTTASALKICQEMKAFHYEGITKLAWDKFLASCIREGFYPQTSSYLLDLVKKQKLFEINPALKIKLEQHMNLVSEMLQKKPENLTPQSKTESTNTNESKIQSETINTNESQIQSASTNTNESQTNPESIPDPALSHI